ncbi:Hypothetical predicted protein [Marmota monax]|uniref:Uncharacterized protein n=1 Tax=Marmota monax TaxID=9995 RepID=A0A5E4B2T4_MARMO|nr:hypothetical protein GHT09_018550 [Marmota monax]VTJ63460.1 Hypothetical predicted protein [Marmota monax]
MQSVFQVAWETGWCQRLEASGWRQLQKASQTWWAGRKIFKDEEAGGRADGGGRDCTHSTAATTAWSRAWRLQQDASFVGTKQQVKPPSVHTPGTQGEPRLRKTLRRDGAAPFAFLNQSTNNRGTALEANPRPPPSPAKASARQITV